MSNPRSHAARLAVLMLFSALVTLGAVGCFNPFDPRIASSRAIPKPPPLPISPAGVLELFQWCWQNRAIAEYRELFTDDYSFQFAQLDSAGNAFRDRPWRREDELVMAENLFSKGTANEPPASSITLDYTQSLVAYRDGRDGKMYPWHQQIRSQQVLRVNRGESGFEVRGAALFYLVRGDSAKLPEELVNRGFQPDSNRWYIERWEDETLQEQGPGAFSLLPGRPIDGPAPASARGAPAPAAVAVAPARARGSVPASVAPPLSVSWGRLKVVYRH